VNVFDFLVQDNGDDEWESDDDDMHAEYAAKPAYATHGFEYGARPISAAFERYDSIPDLRSRANGTTNHHSNGDFVTPDPRRSHARKISTDSAGQKKSGKRKRGQPEDLDLSKINGPDVVMTDVPPVHHSGLTGGLHRLTTQQRNGLPPSPDDSPNSPIKRSRRDDRKDKVGRRKSSDSDKADRKRTKHQRSTREEANGASKTTSKPSATATKPTASKRRTLLASGGARKRSVSPSNSPSRKKPALKAIEYPTTETQQDDSMALVRITHAPTTKPVASFLDCLAKGTDSDEGVSVWRALKRWRRDGGKESGEKELWKGIKIRMNDRGELIICV
jgi:cell growth-regulating nucleolar protein